MSQRNRNSAPILATFVVSVAIDADDWQANYGTEDHKVAPDVAMVFGMLLESSVTQHIRDTGNSGSVKVSTL